MSCYVDIGSGEGSCKRELNRRLHAFFRQLRPYWPSATEGMTGRVASQLTEIIDPQAQGVALFGRGGNERCFFTSMQFAVPMPDRLTTHHAPVLCPLVEALDTYDRYILVLVQPTGVEIREVNLGVASVRAWAANSARNRKLGDVRPVRVGNRLSGCGQDSLGKQAQLIERLLQSGGHTHLTVAGDRETTTALRSLLAQPLQRRLIDVLPLPRHYHQAEVLAASMSSFMEFKARQSRRIANRLVVGLRDRGLVVAGAAASLKALREGLVDTLVMARSYDPEPDRHWDEGPLPAWYRAHEGSRTEPWECRHELIRLASSEGIPVRLVDSTELDHLGGVGCMLRHREESLAEPLPRYREELALVA